MSEEEFKIIKYLVALGDFTIDVGANYGAYTYFLSRLVGAQGCVYSIEPVPSTFEVLSYNVRKLKLANVRCFNCLISNQEEALSMEIPRCNNGTENYYRARVVVNAGQDITLRRIVVPSRTLDSLLEGSTRKVAFLKIDVEGHELQVLEGARKLIQSNKPACLVEIAGDPDEMGSSAHKIFRLFEEFHLSPYVYRNGHVVPRMHGMLVTNYFFLLDNHVESLRQNNMFAFET